MRERRTREQERRSCAVARTSSRSAGCSGISVKIPSISSALRHCALDAKSLAALATSPRRATRKRAASSSPIGVGASSFRSCTMSAVARAAAAGAGAAGAGAPDAGVAPRVSNCGGGRGRGGALCSAGSPGCANEHVKPSVQQRAASHSWLQSSRHCQLQKPAATTPNNNTGDSTTPASCALARRTPAAAICAQAGTGPSEAPTGSRRVKWHGTMRELGFPTESELNYQMVRLYDRSVRSSDPPAMPCTHASMEMYHSGAPSNGPAPCVPIEADAVIRASRSRTRALAKPTHVSQPHEARSSTPASTSACSSSSRTYVQP